MACIVILLLLGRMTIKRQSSPTLAGKMTMRAPEFPGQVGTCPTSAPDRGPGTELL
jgi:hypothetical protein